MIVSLALLGAAIGSLFAGTVSDKYGRRKVIMGSDVCFTIGALMQAFSSSIAQLMIGRVIVGLGVGIASMIVPVYVSEVSPTAIRGKLVATI